MDSLLDRPRPDDPAPGAPVPHPAPGRDPDPGSPLPASSELIGLARLVADFHRLAEPDRIDILARIAALLRPGGNGLEEAGTGRSRKPSTEAAPC